MYTSGTTGDPKASIPRIILAIIIIILLTTCHRSTYNNKPIILLGCYDDAQQRCIKRRSPESVDHNVPERLAHLVLASSTHLRMRHYRQLDRRRCCHWFLARSTFCVYILCPLKLINSELRKLPSCSMTFKNWSLLCWSLFPEYVPYASCVWLLANIRLLFTRCWTEFMIESARLSTTVVFSSVIYSITACKLKWLPRRLEVSIPRMTTWPIIGRSNVLLKVTHLCGTNWCSIKFVNWPAVACASLYQVPHLLPLRFLISCARCSRARSCKAMV